MRLHAKKSLIVIIGSTMMALGMNFFFEPMNMVTGGVSGLAIILKDLTKQLTPGGIPVWMTNLVINIFLFAGSYKVLGKRFLRNTILGTLVFTACLYVVPVMDLTGGDKLLASIFGGALNGAGLGLIFSSGCSSGGTDLLGAILQRYVRHYSVAQTLMVVDGLIVFLGALVFGIDVTLYAIISVFISSKIMDYVLSGVNFAKLALIITENSREISEGILYEMSRGVTELPALGGYSRKGKEVLLCAVDKKELAVLMDIVDKKDPDAFIIVTDAREIFGEGFREYKQ